MPRVVPSQVVDLIDKLFPDANAEIEGQPIRLSFDDSIQLRAVVDLAQQIPAELIILNGSQYAEYNAAIAAIRWSLERWIGIERATQTSPLLCIRGLRQYSPVALIGQALSNCPDQIPSAKTAELKFIRDKVLRNGLRLDISSVHTSLANGEWKAATVLAGSAVEALLLWSLRKSTATARKTAIANAMTNGNLKQRPDNNLLRWDLHEYLEVAAKLNIITAETAQQTRLARDYRNLIHPGKEQRKRMKCDRATALTAVAALEHVVRDLS
jgi:hypothetical protein